MTTSNTTTAATVTAMQIVRDGRNKIERLILTGRELQAATDAGLFKRGQYVISQRKVSYGGGFSVKGTHAKLEKIAALLGTQAPAKRITAATVNAALKKAGKVERLRQGRGYCYFSDGDASSWYSSSVPVCYVSDLSVERWLEELELLRAGSRR